MNQPTKFTQKASTGGFGVINFAKINQLQDVFVALSRLIDYPDQETFSPEMRAALVENPALSKEQQVTFGELFDELNQGTLLPLRETASVCQCNPGIGDQTCDYWFLGP